jgi:hypothetical protein
MCYKYKHQHQPYIFINQITMPLVRIERRFPDTSRESSYQQGTTTCNSFYDPRDIGNQNNGEIAPSGRLATRYPTNVASNSQGFTLPENTGNPKNMFYGSANGMMYGSGNNAGSQGSASDYLIYNKFFDNLLYPHTKQQLQNNVSPIYANSANIVNGRGYDGMKGCGNEEQNCCSCCGKKSCKGCGTNGMKGCGTNAPSNSSATDYVKNNPYDSFSDTFLGSGNNAPSNSSANDYSLNNPLASFAPDTFLGTPIDRMHPKLEMRGNGIDWQSFISKISEGMHKIPAIANTASDVISTIRQLRDELKGEKKKKKKKGKKAMVESEEEEEEEEEPTEESEEEEEELIVKPKKRTRRKRRTVKGRGEI